MKTAIILHGKPSKEGYFDITRQSQSNSHWLPWLQQQLLVNGILAQTPELPEPYDPDYEKWKAVFEQFKIDSETILVGHSRGGGFLVRWLSENKVKVGKVALVAPSLGNPDESPKNKFYDFKIDEDIPSRTDGITIFISTNDTPYILASTDTLAAKWKGVEVKKFADKGHFTLRDMKTEEFPELRDFLLK